MLLFVRLTEKDKQVSDLEAELAELRDSVELHRKKNNVGFPQRLPELYNTSIWSSPIRPIPLPLCGTLKHSPHTGVTHWSHTLPSIHPYFLLSTAI